MVDAVDDLVSGGRLHPRVQRQDPERAERGAEGDEARRHQVHPLADLAVPEQHHTEEARFEEERGQHLVAEQRPGDVADLLHEPGPVGAELEAHRDAADDAEREGQREHLGPEAIGIEPALRRDPIAAMAGLEPANAKEQQHPSHADADRREQDVEGDVGRELHPGEKQRVHARLATSSASRLARLQHHPVATHLTCRSARR
jgi:hypothetical protein